MLYITDSAELKINIGISAIYFYFQAFNFHKKMSIMIEKIEQLYPKIKFYAVDVSAHNLVNLCTRFNVISVPTIIIFKDNGEEIRRITGITLTKAFKKSFTDIYNSYKDGDLNDKKESK